MGDEVEVPLDALVRLPREIVPELVSMPAVAVLHVLAAAANLRSGEHYEQLEDGAPRQPRLPQLCAAGR